MDGGGDERSGLAGDVDLRIREYVADVFDCAPDRVSQVSLLGGGERHIVFRATFVGASGASMDVVVRLRSQADAEACARARLEAAALERVGGRTAPLIYDIRCDDSWFVGPAMCLQFIAGRRRTPADLGVVEITSLGHAVRTVHSIPAGDLPALRAAESVAEYQLRRLAKVDSRLSFVGAELPRSLGARFDRAAALIRARTEAGPAAPGGALALLHGDVSAGNVLWSPRPMLIDWEYARLGDPAEEVGYIFGEWALSRESRDAFWRGYGPDNADVDVAGRVGWWEQVTLLGSALKWLEQSLNGEGTHSARSRAPGIDAVAEGVRRLAQLEAMCDTAMPS